MYARKNPVARARIFRSYKAKFGSLERRFVAIEESSDNEGEYTHCCVDCGVEMQADASNAKKRARIIDAILKRGGI